METFAEFVSERSWSGNLQKKHRSVFTSTGAFIAQNLVLTVAHAIDKKQKAKILYKGKVLAAKELVRHEKMDILLLKVDDSDEYPEMEIRQEAVQIGEKVFGLGFPDAVNRNFLPVYYSAVVTTDSIGKSKSFFQFNGQVSEGSSGTVLVDSRFRVVGVVNSKQIYSSESEIGNDWNFAIKSSAFNSLIQDFLPPIEKNTHKKQLDSTEIAKMLRNQAVCVLGCFPN